MLKEALKHNRAKAIDRPRIASACRQVSLKVPAGEDCRKAGGHDWRFLRGDRYGCCKRCGDEVLT